MKEWIMRLLICLLTLIAPACFATTLPQLPSSLNASPHQFFLSSENQFNEKFDVWNIDGGYSYNLFNSVDLYVGAHVNNSALGSDNGFLSGVSYKVSERIIVKSTLRSTNVEINNEKQGVMAAEISSRMRLSDNLDLHATLDYQEWQQGIEVGLGFRF
ncbi:MULTISPECIES: hypothetical protein [Vibrio]